MIWHAAVALLFSPPRIAPQRCRRAGLRTELRRRRRLLSLLL